MGSVYDYLQYLLKFIASEVPLHRVLGILAVIICLFLLRWLWRQSVKEFKKGLHSRDESESESNSSRPQEPAAAESRWATQFIRVCRASGLAVGEVARELKAGKRPAASPSRRICPKCGRTYEGAGSNFCVADGTELMNSDG